MGKTRALQRNKEIFSIWWFSLLPNSSSVRLLESIDYCGLNMVYILDGQVLQDDDPRVQQRKRSSEQPRQANPNYRSNIAAASGRHANRVRPQATQGVVGQINQQLTSFGIPQFTIANRVVEPIALVGGLILLMVFGVRGLLLGGVLWFVTQPNPNS
ncbi:Uncharacterized protein C10orf35-like protein [Trichoplax sp. H2]|nr:Uncharacterized protein C10orf35-like protein [Trichoplax sp. H2]|eukprot:RDD37439.1 Uncharacterized protein C10orf35-like protein [Trichoplax sp. H2]